MLESRQIITIVISLLLLVIGIFTVGVISTVNNTLDMDYDGHFNVNDPSQDQNCRTGESGLTDITVQRWDGVSWQVVDSQFVTYSTGTTIVTVSSGGL